MKYWRKESLNINWKREKKGGAIRAEIRPIFIIVSCDVVFFCVSSILSSSPRHITMRVRLLVGFLVILFGGAAEAEFGFTSNGNSYSVDTNGGLTFDVNKYPKIFSF